MTIFDNKSIDLKREDYVKRYGPSIGDRIRLADTELLIEIEKDFAVYGDEVTVGYGGTPAGGEDRQLKDCPDMVLANAVILDYTGIVKADIGIRDGHIVGIGKAGNPDIHKGVDKNLVIGPSTQVIQAAGMIVTAGAVDCYAPSLNPQSAEAALCSGVTTLAGCGLGAIAGGIASTSNLGAAQIAHGLHLLDGLPLNAMWISKATTGVNPGPLVELLTQGAAGLMVHEQWKNTLACLDGVLSVADEYDVPCLLQSDTLNADGGSNGDINGGIEATIAAIKGRTTLLIRGSGQGGGHLANLRAAAHSNILPVSIASTLAYSPNTREEQTDAVRLANGLPAGDLADSLVVVETLAAEQVLHDLGVLPIIASGNGSPGRIGELVRRSWQLAHVMKQQRGPLPEDSDRNDNHRVKRYLAKYTINPARALGIGQRVGSIEVNKRADLVLWDPAFFGVTPSTVLVGGCVAASHQGDVAAAVANAQPMLSSRAAHGRAVTFVSRAALDVGTLELFNRIEAVKSTRSISRRDMVLNDVVPKKIEVDPQTYEVRVDGQLMRSEPQTELPMSRLYNLF